MTMPSALNCLQRAISATRRRGLDLLDMSGSPSTEHGDATGPDGLDGSDAAEERGLSAVLAPKQSFPWQVGVSVVTWLLLGGLLVASALGIASTTGGADQGSVDQIQGALGQSAVATSPGNGQHPTLYLLLGGAVLLMALMLLIGQGWARHVLGVLGVVAVIFFAVGGGSWQAIVSFVLLAAGAVLLLNSPSVHYLGH
jgi:hypothetical protein